LGAETTNLTPGGIHTERITTEPQKKAGGENWGEEATPKQPAGGSRTHHTKRGCPPKRRNEVEGGLPTRGIETNRVKHDHHTEGTPQEGSYGRQPRRGARGGHTQRGSGKRA